MIAIGLSIHLFMVPIILRVIAELENGPERERREMEKSFNFRGPSCTYIVITEENFIDTRDSMGWIYHL